MPMSMDLDLAFHQDGTASVRQYAITDRAPLLAARLFQSRLELGSIRRFDEFELITLVRHETIIPKAAKGTKRRRRSEGPGGNEGRDARTPKAGAAERRTHRWQKGATVELGL